MCEEKLPVIVWAPDGIKSHLLVKNRLDKVGLMYLPSIWVTVKSVAVITLDAEIDVDLLKDVTVVAQPENNKPANKADNAITKHTIFFILSSYDKTILLTSFAVNHSYIWLTKDRKFSNSIKSCFRQYCQ
jgi:hypothetical protein